MVIWQENNFKFLLNVWSWILWRCSDLCNISKSSQCFIYEHCVQQTNTTNKKHHHDPFISDQNLSQTHLRWQVFIQVAVDMLQVNQTGAKDGCLAWLCSIALAPLDQSITHHWGLHLQLDAQELQEGPGVGGIDCQVVGCVSQQSFDLRVCTQQVQVHVKTVSGTSLW